MTGPLKGQGEPATLGSRPEMVASWAAPCAPIFANHICPQLAMPGSYSLSTSSEASSGGGTICSLTLTRLQTAEVGLLSSVPAQGCPTWEGVQDSVAEVEAICIPSWAQSSPPSAPFCPLPTSFPSKVPYRWPMLYEHQPAFCAVLVQHQLAFLSPLVLRTCFMAHLKHLELAVQVHHW